MNTVNMCTVVVWLLWSCLLRNSRSHIDWKFWHPFMSGHRNYFFPCVCLFPQWKWRTTCLSHSGSLRATHFFLPWDPRMRVSLLLVQPKLVLLFIFLPTSSSSPPPFLLSSTPPFLPLHPSSPAPLPFPLLLVPPQPPKPLHLRTRWTEILSHPRLGIGEEKFSTQSRMSEWET